MINNKYVQQALEDDDVIWEAFGPDGIQDYPEGEGRILNAMRVAIESGSTQPLTVLLNQAQEYVCRCAAGIEWRHKGCPQIPNDPEPIKSFFESSESEVGCMFRGEEYKDEGFDPHSDDDYNDPRSAKHINTDRFGEEL